MPDFSWYRTSPQMHAARQFSRVTSTNTHLCCRLLPPLLSKMAPPKPRQLASLHVTRVLDELYRTPPPSSHTLMSLLSSFPKIHRQPDFHPFLSTPDCEPQYTVLYCRPHSIQQPLIARPWFYTSTRSGHPPSRHLSSIIELISSAS
jgi:hypothetical protein